MGFRTFTTNFEALDLHGANSLRSGGPADYAGTGKLRCANPVHLELLLDLDRTFPRQPGKHSGAAIAARCRKCRPCLLHRRREWIARALKETAATKGRTWFVTLTLDPKVHAVHFVRACKAAPWAKTAKPEALFRLRCAEFGKDITRWLKRVRKAGADIRYMLVFEPHESGLPHAHLLIHEPSPDKPATKRLLEGQWRQHGFASAKLIDSRPRAAFYIAKYISKIADTKIRASVAYGDTRPLAEMGAGGRSPPRKDALKRRWGLA